MLKTSEANKYFWRLRCQKKKKVKKNVYFVKLKLLAFIYIIVKELFKSITVVARVMTGVRHVVLTGKTMIKKNSIYYYDYYCLENNKFMTQVVLSLQDEEELGYGEYSGYNINGSLYDIVEVLLEKSVKSVLTTELYVIGE